MNFPNSARYDKVMKAVQMFFEHHENVKKFPINPLSIIEENKWGLITYSELAKINNTTTDKIIAANKSEDGFTILYRGTYTIAYNDTIEIADRIRFTLMHEIGHIYLRHLIDFKETIIKRSEMTMSKYKVLENEANAFARNVLAPAPIVTTLKFTKERELMYHFRISYAAARTRLRLLRTDLQQSINFSSTLIERFSNFIHYALKSNTKNRLLTYWEEELALRKRQQLEEDFADIPF